MLKLLKALAFCAAVSIAGGAVIEGTIVNSPITLGSDAAVTGITNKHIGSTAEMKGTPKQVASLAARDLLPAARRSEGMTVWVIDQAKDFRLVGGILNANWLEVATGDPRLTSTPNTITVAPSNNIVISSRIFVAPSGGDDTLALNTALTNYALVELSTGTFLLTNTLILNAGNMLRGSGAGTLLKKNALYSHVLLTASASAPRTNTTRNFSVEDLTINCNQLDAHTGSVYSTARGSIQLNFCDNVLFQNVTITNSGDWLLAFHLQYATNVTFRRVVVDNFYFDAIHIGPGSRNILITQSSLTCSNDAVAIMPWDWELVQNGVDDIENVVVENTACLRPAGSSVGGDIAFLLGSWTNWVSGYEYQRGNAVVNDGNIYKMVNVSGTNTASAAPTHTSGDVTGADGINWRWLQAGTNFENFVKHVRLENITISPEFSLYLRGNDPPYDQAVYPGTEGRAAIQDLRVSGLGNSGTTVNFIDSFSASGATYNFYAGELNRMSPLHVNANGKSNALIVDTNGLVGFGTETPEFQADLGGIGQGNSTGNFNDGGGNNAALYLHSTVDSAYQGGAVIFGGGPGSGFKFAGIKGHLLTGAVNGGGRLDFLTRTTVSDTNLSPKMSIAAAGIIGIGTVDPAYQLEVAGIGQGWSNGNFDDGGGNGAALLLRSTADAAYQGGVILFGAGATNQTFAAIKSHWLSGDGNGSGRLDVLTRTATNDVTLSPKLSIMPSGNVGIGITEPLAKLHVAGSIIGGGGSFTSDVVALTFTGNGLGISNILDAALSSNVALLNRAVQSFTGGTNSFAGYVGIGTTGPTHQLSILGAGQGISTGNFDDSGSKDGSQLLISTVDSAYHGGALIFGAGPANQTFAGIKGHFLSGAGNGSGRLDLLTRTATGDTVLSPKLSIVPDGKVGIGTTAPLSKLTVYDTAADWQLQLGYNDSYFWTLGRKDTAVGGFSGNFDINEGTTNRFTIQTPTGNVGIGTTTPAAKLDVAGDIRASTTINATNGFGVGSLSGMTTNINVLIAGGTTNQLQFTGGILTGVVPQ